MTAFTESVVGQAALGWLESIGWSQRNRCARSLLEPDEADERSARLGRLVVGAMSNGAPE